MKRIYSHFISFTILPRILLVYARRLLKKSKVDNFVGGLLIGALVSLLVNYLTFYVQDELQKQRILEAVENEILNNTLNADNIIFTNKDNIKKNTPFNFFYTPIKFSKEVWSSPDVLSYVVQLPSETQIKLFSYYNIVNQINDLISKTETLRVKQSDKCTALLSSQFVVSDEDFCRSIYSQLLNFDSQSASMLGKTGYETLKEFHPTKDRLNNYFLTLFLGNKSIKVLSN